jgi:hypothetical protein
MRVGRCDVREECRFAALGQPRTDLLQDVRTGRIKLGDATAIKNHKIGSRCKALDLQCKLICRAKKQRAFEFQQQDARTVFAQVGRLLRIAQLE